MRNWQAIGIDPLDQVEKIRHLMTVAYAHARWAKRRGYSATNRVADYYDCLEALAAARKIFTWIAPAAQQH